MDKLVICKLWLQVLVMQLPEAEFLSKLSKDKLVLLNQIWTISVNNCKINKEDIEKVAKFLGMYIILKFFLSEFCSHYLYYER